MCDNADGIVLDHDVQPGNPADAPRQKPAVERVKKRTGQTPRAVAADRGYGEASVDDDPTSSIAGTGLLRKSSAAGLQSGNHVGGVGTCGDHDDRHA